MKKLVLLLALGIIAFSAQAQKKPLDHSVYDKWKSVGGFNMTKDAKYTAFYINEQEGDNTLAITDLTTLKVKTIPRGSSVKVTKEGKYAVFTIKPFAEDIKAAKRKKKKPEDMPKDTLGIYEFKTGSLKKIPYLKSLRISKDADRYFAFQTTPPADTSKAKKAVKKDKDEGTDMFVYDLLKGSIDTIKYVTDFDFDKKGEYLYYISKPNSKDSLYKSGLYSYNPEKKFSNTLLTIGKKQSVRLPMFTDSTDVIAFYAKLDTSKAGAKDISIFVYKPGDEKAKLVLDNKIKGLPQGWKISENRSLAVDKNGQKLFFGISPVMREKDTTLVESEVAKLDIWHYKDNFIQPYQLLNLQREQKKSYLSMIDLQKGGEMIQLATPEYPIINITQDWSGDWAYAVTDVPYELESQWSSNPRCDLYVIDMNTGKSSQLLKDVFIRNVSESDNGKFLVWMDCKDYQWYSYERASGKIRCITSCLNVSFVDEDHDTPEMNFAHGHGGWMKDDKAIFIYDRYDVWQIDPTGEKAPINITDGVGRKERKTFRIVRVDEVLLPPGTPGVKLTPIKPKETIYFSVFDDINKWNGYYFKEMGKKNATMKPWVYEPYTFMYLNRSKDGKVITYVKHNFANSPDVWVTKDNFKTQTKITDINPQQKEYVWGTNELVRWKSNNGFDCDGILYKPENFDPTKKYPMIVYFYETRSELLHYYMAPAPSRSTVNITFFTSNGYLVFMPDIHYTIGHPGKSALDCIVPGVELLCKNPWVDRDNIGIQGQSWGGYQVAYMVTQPQVFKWKAAGAGAPVSNMTSAYGGIRWGSGMVRQFQYEHTQSRIGKTLWDGFDLYIENSPIFFANKIETPLLIMSNDKDEAVPWYQGIEYMTALRRLGKPAWMLQYNNETHNLSDRVNAKDLSIRLSQFFDHFLKGAPMPVWMKSGVPATLKGIDWGLELEK